ncbi:uncharacterized protein [Aquarana catesbeiana]|uniref:uncharacterized protein isoform X2 n=1 Tax=Aquarana catesbeiana TaxID=8400 RepID=UPI003CCA5B8B
MRVFAVIWGSLCLIAEARALRGPSEVTVRHGEDLSVTCYYDDGFESYVKYWCKGAYWKTCNILIKSTDWSKNQYSMEDNPSWGRFTITKRRMRPEDADTYHCGIERNWSDNMHAVMVTVLPGVCRKTQLWASIVDFPPGFETARENEVVKVSCKEQYDNRTFRLTCVKNSDVFQFYPHPEPSSCTRKCQRLTNLGQNISMYPVKEYYGQDEEVTLTCPTEYSPNYNKIRCMRANDTNIWNVTEVFCIYSPRVCRKTQLWASIVDFPPGFETARENEVVKVSCKEQYDNRTFRLTCVKNLDVFQFYPHPDPSSCTRKCQRLINLGQNISMYPVKEYYGQDEEVTLTCPTEYSPNYNKIRCMRANDTNIWNVTEVFCIYSPTVIPIISNHSVSWKNIGVSCCLGVIPPMVVKLITILVILIVKFSGFAKRRSSSVEESPGQRQPDVNMEKSSHRARSNLYYKVTEDQKINEDAEDAPDLLYKNMEVTEDQKIPEDAEDDLDLIYENMEVTEDQKIPEDAEDDLDLIYENMEVTEDQKINENAEDAPDLLFKNMEVTEDQKIHEDAEDAPDLLYKNTEVTEDQKMPEDAEDDLDLIYENMEVTEDQKMPEDAEDDLDLIYENMEVTPPCDVYTSTC